MTVPLSGRTAEQPTNPNPARSTTRRRRSPRLVADAKYLARLLGVGVRSLRTWDYSGKIPAPIKLGARTVWVISEIRAWLAAGAPNRAVWEARKKHDQR
jgi:predicted DNA-binding transcriptional regulator AlpA